MNKLEKAKEIIEENYNSADCGIYNARNLGNDLMYDIYDEDGLTIYICYSYRYFEVFGLTEEEFEQLENYYYNTLS